MTIKPALTPEEWAKLEAVKGCGSYDEGQVKLTVWEHWDEDAGALVPEETILVYGEGDFRYPIADRHACAALCLHGQEFGFTREDARACRDAASLAPAMMREAVADVLDSLADRIEALLPPDAS